MIFLLNVDAMISIVTRKTFSYILLNIKRRAFLSLKGCCLHRLFSDKAKVPLKEGEIARFKKRF
jgi:hypothetical protein